MHSTFHKNLVLSKLSNMQNDTTTKVKGVWEALVKSVFFLIFIHLFIFSYNSSRILMVCQALFQALELEWRTGNKIPDIMQFTFQWERLMINK